MGSNQINMIEDDSKRQAAGIIKHTGAYDEPIIIQEATDSTEATPVAKAVDTVPIKKTQSILLNASWRYQIKRGN